MRTRLLLCSCHLCCHLLSPQARENCLELGRMYRAAMYKWNDKPSRSEGKSHSLYRLLCSVSGQPVPMSFPFGLTSMWIGTLACILLRVRSLNAAQHPACLEFMTMLDFQFHCEHFHPPEKHCAHIWRVSQVRREITQASLKSPGVKDGLHSGH